MEERKQTEKEEHKSFQCYEIFGEESKDEEASEKKTKKKFCISKNEQNTKN